MAVAIANHDCPISKAAPGESPSHRPNQGLGRRKARTGSGGKLDGDATSLTWAQAPAGPGLELGQDQLDRPPVGRLTEVLQGAFQQ